METECPLQVKVAVRVKENWQIQGRAEIFTDAADRHSLWKDDFHRFFTDPDDPN